MAEILWFVFSFGALISLFLLGALWLALAPASRGARRTIVTVSVLYAVAGTYAIAHPFAWMLTLGYRPFQAADVPSGTAAVVVLGSGGFTATDWDGRRFATMDPFAASRVLETARVFRLTNPEWVISSGGLVDPDDPGTPSGASMQDALVRLGIPAARILTETQSANTHDEALIVVPMIRSLNIDHLIVVTSETHMRRSIGVFRAQGVEAIPAIARHDRRPRTWWEWVVPTERGLNETAIVAHEVFGLAAYTWRGWYRWR